MARPVRAVIAHGEEGWDADVDDNFTKIFEQPYPVPETALIGDFDPTLFEDCLLVVGNVLYLSDGVAWNVIGGGAGSATITAWVTFDGTGVVSITDSFNVSSITDRGTGLYTVNFATAMANSDYVVDGSCIRNGTADPNLTVLIDNGAVIDVNGAEIDCVRPSSGTARENSARVMVFIIGGDS